MMAGVRLLKNAGTRDCRAVKMKILIVDDHALIRDALRGILKKLKGRAAVLEASDGRAAISALEEHPGVDLVLLDLNLPDRAGLSVLAELRERFPGVAVVVLSALQDRVNVRKVLDLGALGYLPKSAPREVMVAAFRLIFSGGIYIPPEILGEEKISPLVAFRQDAQPIVSPSDVLSGRELDVLGLLMQGKSNKLIGRMLDVSEPTVKRYVGAILKALKVNNRTQAVVAANDLGWKLPVARQS
jgi:DNA-binding NarL/FixJ family response regulator